MKAADAVKLILDTVDPREATYRPGDRVKVERLGWVTLDSWDIRDDLFIGHTDAGRRLHVNPDSLPSRMAGVLQGSVVRKEDWK